MSIALLGYPLGVVIACVFFRDGGNILGSGLQVKLNNLAQIGYDLESKLEGQNIDEEAKRTMYKSSIIGDIYRTNVVHALDCFAVFNCLVSGTFLALSQSKDLIKSSEELGTFYMPFYLTSFNLIVCMLVTLISKIGEQ